MDPTGTLEIDPESGLIRRDPPRPYPFGPATVADVLTAPLLEDPERLALIDGDRSWTYRELDDAVVRMAGRLVAAGMDAGRTVAWSMPNCAELVIGFLATLRLGATWTGIDRRLGPAEVDRHLAAAGADRLVTTIDELPAELDPVVWPAVDPHSPALVAFTSGSSGPPKAVVHSQHNLIGPGLVSAATEPPSGDERLATPLALTTANMMLLGPLSAFLRHSTAVVTRWSGPSDLAVTVFEQRITRLLLVPTMLYDLVHGDVPPEHLAPLDRVIAGGSGGDPAVLRAFVERFDVRPTLSYGLTEAPTGVVRESSDDPIGSGRGFPLPHVEVDVVDPEGRGVPVGSSGEIRIGPATTGPWARMWSPMLGYLHDPGATAIALAGGRLHTGDLGVMDADGALRVTGRLAEVIVRGGANISPGEVEAGLLEHPDVAEAHVLGLPDERLGEAVGAVVVPQGDRELDPAHLRAVVADQLAAYKVPARIECAAALPRTPLGKIDRSAVLGMFSSDELGDDTTIRRRLVDAITSQTLAREVRALLEQGSDALSPGEMSRIVEAADALEGLGRSLIGEFEEISAALAAAGIAHEALSPLAEERSADRPMLQLTTISIGVGPTNAGRAHETLVRAGFTPWIDVSAGAWEAFRRSTGRTSLVRESGAGYTTQVELVWQQDGAPSIPAPLRPNRRDYALVRLPRAFWPAYVAIRPIRKVAERLGRIEAPDSLGPYLGTPTSLIGPLLDFAEAGSGDTVVDLGCGDGRVLIEAARRGCTGRGIELRRELVDLARARSATAGVSDRVRFSVGDAADAELADASVIFMFLPAEVVAASLDGLRARLPPGVRIVAHEQHALPEALGGERRPFITRGGVTVGHLWRT